jgi:CTP-dependent riboflavin kinase
VILNGTIWLSDETGARTAGRFNQLIEQNAAVFTRYFGSVLFAGSLNIYVPFPATLQQDLDRGIPQPAITIPRSALIGMPAYIGDGQAWRCSLAGAKFQTDIDCWIFRRIGSRVPPGVIEIVAPPPPLVPTFGLRNGDAVTLVLSE